MFVGYDRLDDGPGIYMLVDTKTGERYVGQSTAVIYRIWTHYTELRERSHPNDLLQAAFDRDGETAFHVYLIEAVELEPEAPARDYYTTRQALKSLLRKREAHYIRLFQPEFTLGWDKHRNPARIEPSMPFGYARAIEFVANAQRDAIYRFLMTAYHDGALQQFMERTGLSLPPFPFDDNQGGEADGTSENAS
jgi:hypothetical protein